MKYRGLSSEDIPPHLRSYDISDDEAWWEEGYDARGIKTPEELWSVAAAYFRFQTTRPIQIREVRAVAQGAGAGSELEDIDLPKVRPFSWSGFQVYSGLSKSMVLEIADRSDEYRLVVDRIEATMWAQKFEHASAGAMNANLIARELSLSEKIDQKTTHGGKIVVEEVIIDPTREDD